MAPTNTSPMETVKHDFQTLFGMNDVQWRHYADSPTGWPRLLDNPTQLTYQGGPHVNAATGSSNTERDWLAERDIILNRLRLYAQTLYEHVPPSIRLTTDMPPMWMSLFLIEAWTSGIITTIMGNGPQADRGDERTFISSMDLVLDPDLCTKHQVDWNLDDDDEALKKNNNIISGDDTSMEEQGDVLAATHDIVWFYDFFAGSGPQLYGVYIGPLTEEQSLQAHRQVNIDECPIVVYEARGGMCGQTHYNMCDFIRSGAALDIFTVPHLTPKTCQQLVDWLGGQKILASGGDPSYILESHGRPGEHVWSKEEIEYAVSHSLEANPFNHVHGHHFGTQDEYGSYARENKSDPNTPIYTMDDHGKPILTNRRMAMSLGKGQRRYLKFIKELNEEAVTEENEEETQ